MTDTIHDLLLDRMPDVAAGRATWTADESVHLAACAECREAWELVRGTARLGRGLERGFDGAGAAVGTLQRIRARRASPWNVRRLALGIAAVAAVVIIGVARRGPASVPAVSTTRPIPADVRFLPELDSLSTDELTAVAEELDAPTSGLEATDGQQIFELDSTQLERVLRSLEG